MGLIRKTSTPSPARELRFRDRSKEDLLEQLRDPVASERRWAARDLFEYEDAAPALCDALEKETDASVRTAILASLLKLRNEEIAKRLSTLLASEETELRSAVTEILAEMPEQLAAIARPLLMHEDSDVRIMAVTAVSRLAHPNVPEWLLDVAERDAHPNVVAAALEGLGECGTFEMSERVGAIGRRFSGNGYLEFIAKTTMALVGRRR